jgi:2-polyprenyl-3-methyl-5-hydroxy-6-metoxy-1,4-benzoquinol methylase
MDTLSESDCRADYHCLVRHDVIPLVPKCERLLDVGCGQAGTSNWLRDHGVCDLAYGIEHNADAAEQASHRIDGVVVGDATECLNRLPDSPWDVVLCLDILEHLPDPAAFLARLRPLMSEGGVLIASVPNIAYAPVIIGLLLQRFEYSPRGGVLDSTHLRFFTRRSAVQLLESAGFTVTRTQANRSFHWKLLLVGIATGGLGFFYNAFQYKFVARKRGL